MMDRREFFGLCAVYAMAARTRAIATAPTRRSGKRVILMFATGGWDTTYALDPKEPSHADVPAGAPQSFAGLDVFCDASRPNITGYFERHADVTALVRGICVDAINHNECQRRIATGTRQETHPDFGATLAHELGAALPLPYLILGDTAFTGPYAVSSGRVGTTNQIVELLDPGDGLDSKERAMLADYARASAVRARAIRGATGYNRKRVDDFVEAIARGERMREMRAGFGTRGDALSYDHQVALALDALEHDLSHAVMLSTRAIWDTHSDNALQGGYLDTAFAGLATILDQLKLRPGREAGSRMIDDTVVVAFSEMSRSPYLAGAGEHAGKGHWPVTTALVAGAGVRGGRVFGATDADTISLPIDLATGSPQTGGDKLLYTHFVAGILALCGVDPSSHIDSRVFDAFAV